ncbi:MAG: multicopper oxidase domain-containing protein [Ktedonobacteraceae bacterium]|nr:multicopper oxidase domain-containing protein [Ktedonobacteraceae bacterium]
MNTRGKTRLVLALVLLGVALLVIGALALQLPTATPPQIAAAGLYPYTPQVRNFTLYVRDTVLKLPDGTLIHAFGYTDDLHGHAKIPGPVLTVTEGDMVNLTLVNDEDPTNTKFNAGGDGYALAIDGFGLADRGPVKMGQRYTYHFIAARAGTYWYHCRVNAIQHLQMGLYGAFIVQSAADASSAYPNTPLFNKQYTFVLSEMDSVEHQQEYDILHKGGPALNWNNYQPDYFLMNGRAYPDTMMDPADSINGTLGQTVLVRLINAGSEVHMMHTHGFHFLVIGANGRKLDQSYYKDTLLMEPGERYDIILRLNQVGRFMFHDHIDEDATNNGVYPGGMITMINVNNIDGTNPAPMPSMNTSGNGT